MKKWFASVLVLAAVIIPGLAFAANSCCPAGACCAMGADCCG